MGGIGWLPPLVWAQATVVNAGGGGTAPAVAGTGAQNSLGLLALRRWCGSVTLCSPDPTPNLNPLWAWLAGLGALLLLAVIVQGPGRAFRQWFELAGHVRLIVQSVGRLRRASRVLAAVVGMTVISWTFGQALVFHQARGREDLTILTKARGLGELAIEQGILAAITPLRDVAALSTNFPLLLVATFLVFRAATDFFGQGPPPSLARRREPISNWSSIAWSAGLSLLLYRLICLGTGWLDLPLGNCVMVEAVVIPALMMTCDGMLLGWVLCELRNAGTPDPTGDVLDPRDAVDLLPGSILAAVAALPARHLATFVLLAIYHVPVSVMTQAAAGRWIQWQLHHGLMSTQAAALPLAGLAAGTVWSRGDLGGTVRGYLRVLRAEGARLCVMFALAGLFAGVFSAASYFVVLSFPASPWLINAADSYAHYFSLPAGLWLLSVFVELGERALPEATLVPVAGVAESTPV